MLPGLVIQDEDSKTKKKLSIPEYVPQKGKNMGSIQSREDGFLRLFSFNANIYYAGGFSYVYTYAYTDIQTVSITTVGE